MKYLSALLFCTIITSAASAEAFRISDGGAERLYFDIFDTFEWLAPTAEGFDDVTIYYGKKPFYMISINAKGFGNIQFEINSSNQYAKLSSDRFDTSFALIPISRSAEPIVVTEELLAYLKTIQDEIWLHLDKINEFKNDESAYSVKYLFRAINLLVSLPVGWELDHLISKPQDRISSYSDGPTGWVDICSSYANEIEAYWTKPDESKNHPFTVGGNGWDAGSCGTDLSGFGNTIYSQGCLNYGVCAQVQGEPLGMCEDEWLAAVDDYIFSPVCIN